MLRRRWLLIVAVALLTVGPVLYVSADTGAQTYNPQAELLVREGLSGSVTGLLPPTLRNTDRDWNTRVAGLRSIRVAETAAESGSFDIDPQALAARVQVQTDDKTGYVQVSVGDPDPQMAADLTNAVAQAYAADARAIQEAQLERMIASAEGRLASARERIVLLDRAPESGTATYLGVPSYEQAATLVDTLMMGASMQVDPVVIVRAAQAPAEVAWGVSDSVKAVLVGLLAGVALGVTMALALEYLARANASGKTSGA
jgi:capsular polysaccharide biosynthesis protein